MILHNSWLSHLRDINAADQANRNFNAFTNATDVDKQKNDKINAISEDPDSIVLIADNHRRIKFVHSCKKFGGTRINPVVTVGGLVGQGARAFPVAVDLETATSSKNVIIPSLDKRNKKKSFEEKARERSISVGMDHGMALLGKSHKNESNSRLCVLERTSELLRITSAVIMTNVPS
jgi:hypothetical protein